MAAARGRGAVNSSALRGSSLKVRSFPGLLNRGLVVYFHHYYSLFKFDQRPFQIFTGSGMSYVSHTDRSKRIDSWAREVASAHEQRSTKISVPAPKRSRAPLLPTPANASKRKRSTTQAKDIGPCKRQRQTLLPTSTNPRPRKQGPARSVRPARAGHQMSDKVVNENAGVRKSARDRRPTEKVRQDDQNPQMQELAYHPSKALGNPSLLQKSQRLAPSSSAELSNADSLERPCKSPSKSSGSPAKSMGSPQRGDRMLGKQKADKSLDMDDLSCLTPAVRFMGVEQVLLAMGSLPKPVALLRDRLSDRSGYAPQVLEVGRLPPSTPNGCNGAGLDR